MSKGRKRAAQLMDRLAHDKVAPEVWGEKFIELCDLLGVSLGQGRRNDLTGRHVTMVCRLLKVNPRTAQRRYRIALSPPIARTYLLHCRDTGRLKVGYTTRFRQRIYCLAHGGSGSLTLVGYWYENCEDALKRMLRKHRHHGEWYNNPGPKMIERILSRPGFVLQREKLS